MFRKRSPRPTELHLDDIRDQRDKSALINYVATRAKDSHTDPFDGKNWFEHRDIGLYKQSLPRYGSLNFYDLIKDFFDDPFWLDYGCGENGKALSQLLSDPKMQHVRAEGVTLPIKRKNLPNLPFVHREFGDDFLRSHRNTYDVITAVQAIHYSPDQLNTVKLAYAALKPGGFLFIDNIRNDSMPIVQANGQILPPKELERRLKSDGYDVIIRPHDIGRSYSLVLRKSFSKPRLILPVALVKIPEMELSEADRAEGQFVNLGQSLPALHYVYRLIE